MLDDQGISELEINIDVPRGAVMRQKALLWTLSWIFCSPLFFLGHNPATIK